jgi:hypothetical protein
MRRDGMNGSKANGSKAQTGGPGPDARMLMHEDEHAIVTEILKKALDDDDYFASRGRSEPQRLRERHVLATFLQRIERQFALRPLGARRSRRALFGPSDTQR